MLSTVCGVLAVCFSVKSRAFTRRVCATVLMLGRSLILVTQGKRLLKAEERRRGGRSEMRRVGEEGRRPLRDEEICRRGEEAAER
jgi:hypothetical protein